VVGAPVTDCNSLNRLSKTRDASGQSGNIFRERICERDSVLTKPVLKGVFVRVQGGQPFFLFPEPERA